MHYSAFCTTKLCVCRHMPIVLTYFAKFGVNMRGSIADEFVYRNHTRQPINASNILDAPNEIGNTRLKRSQFFAGEVVFVYSAVQFQRARRCHNHNTIGTTIVFSKVLYKNRRSNANDAHERRFA